MIQGMTLLARFAHPYAQPTYFGSPCSPGLGMLLLYAPFVLSRTYHLGAVAAAGLAIAMLRRQSRSAQAAGVMTLLLFASPLLIELMVVGSDLVLLGCGLVVLAYGLVCAVASRHRSALLVLALLAGLLASTRVNFLLLPPLLAALIASHWRRGAAAFLLLSSAIAVLPSALLYGFSPAQFTPLHLLGKSAVLLQGGLRELAIATTAAALLLGLQRCRASLEALPMALLLALAPPMISLAAGDLWFVRAGDLARWEGANYLMPLIPLATALLATRITPRQEGPVHTNFPTPIA